MEKKEARHRGRRAYSDMGAQKSVLQTRVGTEGRNKSNGEDI